MMRPGRMGDCAIDQIPTQSDADELGDGGALTRQEWVRANFTQIFGTSAADLQARGTDPRQYARDHRHQIRRFAQMQRRHGIAVPDARPSGANPTAVGNGPYGTGTGRGTVWPTGVTGTAAPAWVSGVVVAPG